MRHRLRTNRKVLVEQIGKHDLAVPVRAALQILQRETRVRHGASAPEAAQHHQRAARDAHHLFAFGLHFNAIETGQADRLQTGNLPISSAAWSDADVTNRNLGHAGGVGLGRVSNVEVVACRQAYRKNLRQRREFEERGADRSSVVASRPPE